ncbi:uncharacterized protein BO87DRAFT_26694 [Aspergillus neoniger CBS 115656]|uniref:Uncharacterized protein n=1 Tax=Aspergillus neoniger (strain CBS 115656) TaxID=1448310 RepID=A0A318YRA9_ASPNB|nr:hypothetical protein BO87DRAFT_26694 [Aspergillus neoniger CBS 115656]PYH35293.1 hypothetical protein BO87DRAFT_26694 [Aspergillus neoniger CBS 115656]
MAGMQGGMFSHIFCDGAGMKTQSLSSGNWMLLTARGRVSVVRRRLRIGESLLVSTPRCDSSSRTNFAKREQLSLHARRGWAICHWNAHRIPNRKTRHVAKPAQLHQGRGADLLVNRLVDAWNIFIAILEAGHGCLNSGLSSYFGMSVRRGGRNQHELKNEDRSNYLRWDRHKLPRLLLADFVLGRKPSGSSLTEKSSHLLSICCLLYRRPAG